MTPLSQPLTDSSARRRIFEERARALARRTEQTDEQQGEEVVIFRVGDAGYALPAKAVREVYPLEELTPLPSTPAFLLGLVNVRGRILAALDIHPLLGLPQVQAQFGAVLLLVGVGDVEVGLLADAVLEIAPGDTSLTPPLSSAAGTSVPWVRGVDRRLNLVLDPAGLLSDSRLDA